MRALVLALTLSFVFTTTRLAAAPADPTPAFERLQVAYWQLHGDIVHEKKFDETDIRLVIRVQRGAQRLMTNETLPEHIRHLAASVAGATFNLTGALDLPRAEETFPPVRDAMRELIREFMKHTAPAGA